VNSLDAALLSALRSSSVHLPAGDLAKLLRTTDQSVIAAVEGLREAGFEIEERPGLGYRLVGSPDRLIADDLRSRIGENPLIREILVFEETDSTNERLLQLGAAGTLGGLALFAEHQTTGRGRFTRRWESASHCGLWFSLLLRPSLPLSAWTRLTTWAAVALADAIEQCTGLQIRIKWPNDLEIAGKKFAGILIETATDRAGESFAVVGIGVNVNHQLDDFAEAIRPSATSLRMASRRLVDRPTLAAEVLRTLARWYVHVTGDFAIIIHEARRRSSLLGRAVALQLAGEQYRGVAEDLSDDGRLLVRLGDGRSEIFAAGEATVLRD
jgi:BirA family biotin operon repressor/biotin-[acetyl-CoA-carboxylase] ligase